MMNERRVNQRKPVSLEAWWESLSGRHTARVSDISLDGCFIDSTGRTEASEQIDFSVKLPDGHSLRLRGMVVSVDPKVGFGVRLIALPESERQWRAFVVSLSADDDAP